MYAPASNSLAYPVLTTVITHDTVIKGAVSLLGLKTFKVKPVAYEESLMNRWLDFLHFFRLFIFVRNFPFFC